MKKLLIYTAFTAIFLTLYGCPVGLDYPLGTPGTEKIDEKLIGTWKTENEDAEVKEFVITKKDTYSYQVEVIEEGSTYMLETNSFTGWITKVEGITFLFLQAENESVYYHYMIKEISKNSMISCDLSLLDKGSVAATSTESLIEEVKSSLKKDGFCAETITWKK